VLKDLGRRIAELRQERDMTQAKFAERLAVTARYVQSIEGGHENLTVESLTLLGWVLDAPVAALFESPTSRVVRRGRPKK
jgi:transcriptional regulator with XRE-family HTH domain